MVVDHRVAAPKAFDGEGEAAELVFAIRVSSGDVENEIGMEFGEAADEMRFEDGEIVFVSDAVGKIGVEIGWRLGLGIVVFLMNGKSEDGIVARENRGGAVALMNVRVDDHGGLDGAVVLQAANGDGDVVDDAETFAVIRKSVMKTSADVRRRAVREGALPCFDGTAGSEPAGFHEFLRVRNFHAQLFDGAERAGFEFVNVFGRVDAENIFVGSGSGHDKIGGRAEFLFDKRVMNEAVFLRREDVRSKVKIESFVIDKRN